MGTVGAALRAANPVRDAQHRSYGIATMLLLVFSLAGCQALPPIVHPDADVDARMAWSERRDALSAMDTWTLRGRLAVSAHGRGWNGTLHWEQAGDDILLRLIAPMGAGTVRIEGSPELMHIRGTDGTDVMSVDPDNDLAAWIGTPLPVSSLRWWVLGLPDPESPVPVELDTGGRSTGFEQRGWQVSFPRYTLHDGVVVPGMIVAENADSRLRMVVDHWERDD